MDASLILKSVFLLISATATSNALWRKFAPIGNGGSWMTFPSGRNRWDQGLTAAEMKRCRWVKPKMVCQVKFTEWTRDDRLRQPVFLGIREDKIASKSYLRSS